MASRNLGSLTIDLVAKTGGFTAGLSKAERELESRGKRMNNIAKKIGTGIGVAISAGVAAGGVLATALKVSIDRMDELSKAAQRAQLPTEQFSQLVYAGDLADVSMQNLVTSFGRLAKAQGDAAAGLKTQTDAFKQLDINFKNADGTLRDSTEVFKDFADRYQQFQGTPEVLAAGMQIFGRSFQNLIPLLKGGREGLEAAANEADRLGITLSTEAGQQAEEFNDNLTRLKTAVAGLSQTIAGELLPDLIRMTERTLKWVNEGDNAKQIALDVADGLRAMADAAFAAKAAFDSLGTVRSTLADLEKSLGRFTPGAITGIGERVRASLPEFLYRELGQRDQAGAGGIQRLAPLVVRPPGPDASAIRVQGPAAKAAKKQLTEEEKAAEQLKRAYESLTESMRERIALFGEETEVAKVTYEIQQGSLKALDEASKQSLLTQAAELDALRERQEIEEEGKRLIEGLLQPFEQVNAERKRAAELLAAGAIAQEDYNRAIAAHKTPAEEMLEDMLFEIELLGKTREEQELLTAARYLGAEAATAQGQAALQALADYQQAAKSTAEATQFMDGVRDSFGDFFTGIIDGSKSAKEAFKDLVTDILAQITKLMVNRAIEQLFGAYGTTGQGTTGGGFFASLFSGLSGGRANGGNVNPFSMVEVNERGFETATVGGRQYLLAGDSPVRITPNNMLGGGGLQQTNNLVVQGRVTRRTEERMAQLTGREGRRALARTGH